MRAMPHLNRRLALGLAALAATCAFNAAADTYPSKPVSIVVAYAPGLACAIRMNSCTVL